MLLSVLLVTIAPTVSAIVSARLIPLTVNASASTVPSKNAFLNCSELVPKSTSLVVTGAIRPSAKVT